MKTRNQGEGLNTQRSSFQTAKRHASVIATKRPKVPTLSEGISLLLSFLLVLLQPLSLRYHLRCNETRNFFAADFCRRASFDYRGCSQHPARRAQLARQAQCS